MNRFLTLLIIFFFAVSSFAQDKSLSGFVFTDSYTAIDKVSVLVSYNDSVVGLGTSNESGRFEIEKLPDAKVRIYINHLGYAALSDSVDLREEDSYMALLHDASVEMDSVTVLGKRPPIRTPYGHLYFLSKEAAECGNPYKALQEIPKLRSDYISETLNSEDGKGILFLVDGAEINTGLTPIDPSRIAYVEVLDVVSAKYLRTGAGRIVNVHLKESKALYTYIRLGGGNNFPWKENWALSELEIGNSKVSFFARISPSWVIHKPMTYSYLTNATDYERAYSGRSDSRSHNMNYTAMLKLRPTKKDNLILSFQGGDAHSTDTSDGSGQHKDKKEGAERNYMYDKTSSARSHVYTSTLYYNHNFSNALTMDGTAAYTLSHSRQLGINHQTIGEKRIETYNPFTTKRHAFNQKLNFSWKLNEDFALDFGNSTAFSTNAINQDNLPDIYKYKELDEYIFAAFSAKLGDFSTVLSAGADYMHLNSAGYRHSYMRPNISTDISYEKGIFNTSLEYQLTNGQPSIGILNPYNTSTDSLYHTSGNPMLVPQRTHDLYLSGGVNFNGINLDLSLDYSYTKDVILPYSYYDDGIYYSTYNNAGAEHSLGFQLNASYRRKAFFLSSNSSFGSVYYPGLRPKHNFTQTVFAMWSYKSLGIHGDLTYTNKSNSRYSTTRYHGIYMSSIALSYNVNPNLIFILGCHQFLGTTRYTTHMQLDDYENFLNGRQSNSQLFVTIRWTMRKNQKHKININENKIKENEKGIKL